MHTRCLSRLFVICAAILLFFSCSAHKQVPNDWTDSVPGTIIITGHLSDVDFQAFYNQTLFGFDEYTVILNTDGGSAEACTGIISRIAELQREGVRFTTVVYSKAYSAGAFIWMMGDHRIMHEGAALMLHTMRSQAYNDLKELPSAYGEDREELIVGLDDHIIRLTKKAMSAVNPMTLETMLEYTGNTFINAKEANTLGIVDEYIEN